MTPSRKKTKKNSSNRRHVSVSIRDVAKRAGVSISTVSRAVNGITSVEPKLAKRVWKAVAEVGGILFPHAQELILTAPRQSRAIAPEALRGVVDHPNVRLAAHIEDALRMPAGDAVTFITGSLFLVAEARAILAPL